ncbi:transposase family protein [Singulisphaera sp. Ch08]|uniref:Transposase family protein n=1 Tax=Singulisphaera sp. Ch08 TaxID=3120278 RepID=A0AAU7CJ97_9BACT
MANIKQNDIDEIIQHFAELEDPRSTINRQHPLSSVLVIALMAVLAGAAGPTAIAKWAAMKEEFLVKLLDLPVVSHERMSFVAS